MKIKTFKGKTMSEVLFKVKTEMGKDAVILSTGKGIGNIIEVSAAIDETPQPVPFLEYLKSRDQKENITEKKFQNTLKESEILNQRNKYREITRSNQNTDLSSRQSPSDPNLLLKAAEGQLSSSNSVAEQKSKTSYSMKDLEEIKQGLEKIARHLKLKDYRTTGVSGSFIPALIESGADEEIVDRLASSAGSTVEDEIKGYLTGQIKTSGPIRIENGKNKVVALIGPTGVGKTTTIAKIAAHYAIKQNKKVAIISLDNYRIAAVQQIESYADIMGIPIRVALQPDEMITIISGFNDYDLTLIDTTGRSPYDWDNLLRMAEFLKSKEVNEVHLLLSATSDVKNIKEVLDGFSPFRADRLILTKLDEGKNFGHLLWLYLEQEVPFSYVTHGQKVPDDIAIAQPELLVSLLCGEISYVGSGNRTKKTSQKAGV